MKNSILLLMMFATPAFGQQMSAVSDNVAVSKEQKQADSVKSNAETRATTTVYIQNETVVGPKTYTGDVIKVGSNVTSSKTKGPVTFKSGAITLTGREITFYPQTTMSKDSNITLTIKK